MWKDVNGYEGIYQVSSTGIVRNKKTRKVLSTFSNNNGYKRVNFFDDKKPLVHRLVAEAFIPNPKGYTDVNHKDNKRSNNKVSNLEWTSHYDNIIQVFITGARSNSKKNKFKDALLAIEN